MGPVSTISGVNPSKDVRHALMVPNHLRKAQLVFGTPAEGAREKLSEKAQQPIEERLFIHGA